MGNYISKISKDCLLAFEEFMKNKTSFEKEKIRPSLNRLTGGTYTRIHSIKGLSKKESFAPLETGMWWKNYFTRFADRPWFFSQCEIRGWYWFSVPPLRILGLYCRFILILSLLPKFGKPASNKKKMMGYIKKSHTVIFTGQTGCGKTHHVLGLIEKEYYKNFDYIVIICPIL